MPTKLCVVYFACRGRDFKNNLTHPRFSSCIMTLEPNIQKKKENSIFLFLSKDMIIVIGRGAWTQALPPVLGVTMKPCTYERFLGPVLRTASSDLTYPNSILFHQPPTHCRQFPLQLSQSNCLAHRSGPWQELFQQCLL